MKSGFLQIHLNHKMETVIGGLFNAVAFAGAGFLFSKLNHNGYENEIKRHNEAMGKWYENQVEKKEIEKLRQLSDANINRTNMSLKTLAEVNDRVKSLEKEYNILSDYYKPSEEMKEYQTVAITVIGLSGRYIIYKF